MFKDFQYIFNYYNFNCIVRSDPIRFYKPENYELILGEFTYTGALSDYILCIDRPLRKDALYKVEGIFISYEGYYGRNSIRSS